MAARLNFAGIAQMRWIDAESVKRAFAGDDRMIGQDGAEFEWERVERSPEFLSDEKFVLQLAALLSGPVAPTHGLARAV